MPYTIQIKKSALRELEKLPLFVQENIALDIADLASNPRPNGCKKLKGNNNFWRIRIGDYRVLYTIEDDVLFIEIIRIAHRKDVYEKY